MNEPIISRASIVQSAASAYVKRQGVEACPYLPGSCAYHAWLKHLDKLNTKYPPNAHVGTKRLARGHFNVRKGGGQ